MESPVDEFYEHKPITTEAGRFDPDRERTSAVDGRFN